MIKPATALLCMDYRILEAVRTFCLEHFEVLADEVTEPGIVRILAGKPPMFPNQPLNLGPWIQQKAKVSVQKHASTHAIVVGHMHCAGNTVPDHEHHEDIRVAVKAVRSWGLFEAVVGLWAYEVVGGKWALSLVTEGLPEMRMARAG